jgi:predicted O-methyltransferase YrrM
MLVTNFTLKYALYRIVCAGYQLLDVGRIHPARERSIRELHRTVDYVESHMADALGLEAPRECLAYGLAQATVPGHYLEFGVFTGGTIRYIAKQLRRRGKPDASIHGFDSFEGLPEAWSGFNLGSNAFSVGGKLPRVPSNVVLHKGWFRDTIPRWLTQFPGPVAFVHVDCDLYSSTVEVLEGIRPRLQPGTVLVFDEYFNFPNWKEHEFKAWAEFVVRHGISYQYLAYARQQVAVRIVSISPSAI